MNASVENQPLHRFARDFAANRIEAGQNDRVRRVVDQHRHARGGFKGANVAPFAPDDASLQVVARQIDDGDGGFDRVVSGRTLNGFRDVLLRLVRGGFAGFENFLGGNVAGREIATKIGV